MSTPAAEGLWTEPTRTFVGKCIYCGDDKSPLTDEHHIPEALGARGVLVKASCRRCQKVINEEFEQFCLREMFNTARKRVGFGSRRRRPPRRTQLVVVDKDTLQHRSIVLENPPAMYPFPAFEGPTYVNGQMNVPMANPTVWMFQETAELGDFRRQNNAFAVRSPPVRFDYFARWLAKMAHGFAVNGLGLNGFDGFLPPLILGQSSDLNAYIGSKFEEPDPEDGAHAYMLYPWTHMLYPWTHPLTGEDLVIFQARLFACFKTPTYTVVVGRLAREWPYLRSNESAET